MLVLSLVLRTLVKTDYVMLLVAGNMAMCKKNYELVDRATFIDSVGILSAHLKDKDFSKLCDSLV